MNGFNTISKECGVPLWRSWCAECTTKGIRNDWDKMRKKERL